MLEDVEHRVVGRRQRTPVIVELTLRPVGARLDFRPGQYVLVGDVTGDVPVRSYSVANAPRPNGELTLLVTRVAGGETSTWLHDDVRDGDTLLVSGPYGTFVSTGSGRPVLALAAGSGLAPVRALAEETTTTRCVRPFTVVFSARTEADVMDAALVDRWSRRNPGLWFVRTLTRGPGGPPHGHVPTLLPRLFHDLHDHEVFVAGPPGFVSACAEVARRLGAGPGRVRTEEFFADPRPWVSPLAPPVLA
ncbi:MAG TPA: FAD-binding oxidoreductase [Actinomycetales bacterium]|nr:FAD-binding oxidoreductase [Actinomycetales bacterium]